MAFEFLRTHLEHVRDRRRDKAGAMIQLPKERLEKLRERLSNRGRRPSLVRQVLSTSPELVDAMELVEKYGAMCEAVYLVMAADKRVTTNERELLRGALDVLSGGRVRSLHMDAMLDAAARKVSNHGVEARLAHVVEVLREDPARAEATAVLAVVIMAATDPVAKETEEFVAKLLRGLEVEEERASRKLDELSKTKP